MKCDKCETYEKIIKAIKVYMIFAARTNDIYFRQRAKKYQKDIEEIIEYYGKLL